MPLFQHVMVGKRMHDLFAHEAPTARDTSQKKGNPAAASEKDIVNPQLVRIARDDGRIFRDDSRRPRRRRDMPRNRPARSHFTPLRADVVDQLDNEALLPAIYFIFSRAGCEAAMLQCLRSGLRLTSPAERDEIKRGSSLHPDRRHPRRGPRRARVPRLPEALTAGSPRTTPGCCPRSRSASRSCSLRGLVKVVFATETLALGINMPARGGDREAVKWNGETHADITPGEYTQLTGRAGRRGIDVEGHGVVLWQPGFDPQAVAGLASTRTYRSGRRSGRRTTWR